MRVRIKTNKNKFKTMLDILFNVTNEAQLRFWEHGLELNVLSGGNIAVNQLLKKELFDEYEIDGVKEEFGIILKDLVNPLKKMGDDILFYHDNGRLVLESGSDTYKMPIIVDVETRYLPTLEYNIGIEMPYNKLTEVVNKIKLIGDDNDPIEFFSKDGVLMAKCVTGDRTREVTTEVAPMEGELKDSLFTIRLIEDVLSNTSDTIILKLRDNTPLSILYNTENTEMLALVAPRVRT